LKIDCWHICHALAFSDKSQDRKDIRVFKKIMTPVDLAHQDHLEKALQCTADLAKHYGAEVVFVGVTASTPSAMAHNPAEYAQKLDAFVEAQSAKHGISGSSLPIVSHDPTTDVDDALLKATRDTGADLVVMASHLPSVFDYIWPSNGGKIAEHAKCSVFVIRT
jgi:nucleotide-binding universal stress UspA family protein